PVKRPSCLTPVTIDASTGKSRGYGNSLGPGRRGVGHERAEGVLGSEPDASVKGQYHARLPCRGWRSQRGMRGTRPARIARSADAAARVTERSTLASGPDPRPRLSRRTQLSGKCAAHGARAGPRATCSGVRPTRDEASGRSLAREFLDHRAALLLGMLELAAETLGRLAAVLRLEALLLDPQQMLLDVALARLELLARRFAVGGRRDRPLDAGGRRSAFIRLQPADARPGHAQLDTVAHEVDAIAVLPVA